MTGHCWLQIIGGVNPRSLAAQGPGRGIKRVIVKGCGFILCAESLAGLGAQNLASCHGHVCRQASGRANSRKSTTRE